MDLHIRGVSKTYPSGVRALDDVSLTIPAGMYGLLGPNGAGKSTLMRILATLQEPDSGSIRLGGIDLVEHKDEVRRRKLGGYSLAWRTLVRVLGDTAPGPGFEAAEPELEDVYFGAMAGHVGRRGGEPRAAAAR